MSAAAFAAQQSLLLAARGTELLVFAPDSALLRVGLASGTPLELAQVVAFPRRGAATPSEASEPAAPLAAQQEAAVREAEAAGSCTAPADLEVLLPPLEPALLRQEGSPCFSAAALAAHGHQLVWPLLGGRLAVTAEQPLSTVLAALEALWLHACCAPAPHGLGLTTAQLRGCSAVLVAPATLSPREVRELSSLLLRSLHVAAVTVYSEPPCLAAAVSAPFACCVLLGTQTATATCVEEHAVVPGSSRSLSLGVDDAALALPRLCSLCRALPAAFPAELGRDAATLRRILLAGAVAPPASPGSASLQPPLRIITGPSTVALGGAASLAPMGLFRPALLGRTAAQAAQHDRLLLAPGPEDEWFAEAEPECSQLSDSLGLDAAVTASVAAAAAGREGRARLLAQVLLAGAGAALPGLGDALSSHLPAVARVVVCAPDAAWRGGALLGCLEPGREGWARQGGAYVGGPGRFV